MKNKLYLLVIIVVLLISPGWSRSSAGSAPVRIDILFMNHGPMQPTIRALRQLIQKHGPAVEADWYDFERESGRDFMKKHDITGHIPCLILVNGRSVHQIGGRDITFKGFPTGAGPYQFQGKWSLQDLESLIESLKAGPR